MNELIGSFIQSVTGDGALDFNRIFEVFLAYLVVLWVAFSVWVFVDAYKRFKNIFIAILLTLFVLILNFPALILYLVIRPEEELEMHRDHASDYVVGGVDVPIVKFVGEKGEIKMSLNLHISSSLHKKADMTLDLGVVNDREDLKIEKLLSSDHKPEKPNNDLFSRTQLSIKDKLDRAAKSAKVITRKIKPAGSAESADKK